MKAIVHYMYGRPEMLELRDIGPLAPKPKEGAGRRACFAAPGRHTAGPE